MEDKIKLNWSNRVWIGRSYQTWTRILLVVLLLLGIFFRFVNLDRKVYWYDETITSMRVSGYRQKEMIRQIFDGHELKVEDLQKYQRISSEKDLVDTAYSLATEAPQHPPLYFVMARFWMQWLGNSVDVLRSLSALISLLAFPCLYWLCLELFNSSLVGWLAIALMAVSPFYILYAQEAREYSLWTVTILLSSAALLRAMRRNTKLSWLTYSAALAVSIYSFTFSLFVAGGHAIYVALIEKFKLTKIATAYLLASLIGLVTFTPWLIVIIIHLLSVHELSAWTNISLPLLTLTKEWLLNFSRIFLDFNLSSSNSLIYLLLPIIFFEAYAVYFVCRQTPARVWLFILTLIGTTALALMLPDLLIGGQRSSITRYLIPSYLGIQLAVAYLISTRVVASRSSQQKLWQVVLAVLITIEVISCTLSSQAEIWWNKYESWDNLQVAHVINHANHPLLISDSSSGFSNVFSLSYLLDPRVRMQLFVSPNRPNILNRWDDVFLYRASDSLRKELEKKYKMEPVYRSSDVWRLKH